MGDDSITTETLSVYDDPRPFKSEAYLQKMGANGAPVASRRNKTLKQILNQERDMFLQRRNAEEGASKRLKTDEASADAMDVDPLKPLPRNGNYTDPKTRLRYHSMEIYDIIKGFLK
ncbi:hypothetical protein MEQU1_001542 [Malassezia equina]|uniref:Vps72/YL1 C-terminal domain-containing protein n=1 Tax=Malassezia equina TaxID=1381935 RepID=A0AAF0EE13_9BASI|nr:hypothetical protein MEQU1_001542 [Malassezia equina]